MSELLFADDIVVVAESAEKLEYNLGMWEEELRSRGFKINIAKTKTMVVERATLHTRSGWPENHSSRSAVSSNSEAISTRSPDWTQT